MTNRKTDLDGRVMRKSGVRVQILTSLFHLATFSFYCYTVYYDETQLGVLDHRNTYAGKAKFLTIWNLYFQLIFFGYSVLNDLFGSNSPDFKSRSTLQIIRDKMAACVAFPCGLLVVAAFWSVYAVDRELIFPAALDKIVPSWLNHAWHTTVIVFLLIEKFLVLHHYPSRTSGLLTSVSLGLIYQVWILWIAYVSGIWVYPVLEVLNWPLRIAFLASCWIGLAFAYITGEFLTKLFWPKVSQKKIK